MNLTLADVQRCLSGVAEEGYETIAVNSVQTDSRTVAGGDLFVCLDGERFDGHEFAAQAVKNGAVAVICSRLVRVDAPAIMVRDTTKALGRIAACWRDMCKARLIAVTGTAGKTTVKEMLFAVLSQKFSVARNYRNFNNQIGLPMSMLKADSTHDLWIMELGISTRGDMEELAPVAGPDIAVITNIGAGHLEGLHDEAGVAVAKTTLLKHLRPTGIAVISRDYPLLWDTARTIVNDPVGFSTQNRETDFTASFLGGTPKEGWGHFRLQTPEGDGEFSAPFCGEHYAENLACVAAVAAQLGMGREAVIKGVQAIEADSQRFCCKTAGKVVIIDDSYNANPLSMSRSIEAAAAMTNGRPLVVVLGDMRELGVEAKQRHEELGKHLKGVAPTAIFYKGDHHRDVIRGLGESHVVRIDNSDEFIRQWRDLCLTEAVVLVKGSRSLKMEEFADALCKELGNNAGTGR